MFYFEQRTQLGRWSPVTTPARPGTKSGRLAKVGGAGPMIRRVKRVDAELEHLTLDELAAGYGNDGDGWREPESMRWQHISDMATVDDAELVDEPVFRSTRAAE